MSNLPDCPTYVPTPSLSDNEGQALLSELYSLNEAIWFEPKTRKKVRAGSHEQHWATVKLRSTMLNAARKFPGHQDFVDWLLANKAYELEANYPVLKISEMSNEIYNMKVHFKLLEDHVRNINDLVHEIVTERLRAGKQKEDAS